MLNLRGPLYDAEGAEGASPPQGESLGWRAQLPDNFKHDPEFADMGNIGVLARQFKERGEQLGKVPRAPEDISAYEFDALEVPDGLEYNAEATMSEIRSTAKELGLSVEQAKKLHKMVADREIGYLKSQSERQADETAEAQARVKAVEQDLRQTWGDKYDGEIQLVSRVAQKFFGENFAKTMNEAGVGNSAEFMKGLSAIGHAMSEDTFEQGSLSGKGEMSHDKMLAEMYGNTTPSEGAGYAEMLASLREED